ncbi:3-hydroxyisobutyrate dehydrogenase [uncultured Algimonas sp.]|uniref:3-hydroxyisobutyrate dehydrogenase n=1 Tax=uncultured Algimonas sp. TaxID=1547920 RepID=UPI00262362CA|nr:3-hydroxyisobutyrate dehydrogenase [uncultured Algimonas sp.]
MIIAFIGLGNMGGGMAANLAKPHEVRAFDLSGDAVAKACDAGCSKADTVAAAVSGADAVVTMLPAGQHVRAVYADVFEVAAPGTLMIDCSTVDVDSARTVIGQATDQGFDMIDAPVSGGVKGAADGTLTFMCGGTQHAFARAEPLLEIMGKNVFHAGDAGNGQVAKICNNMLLGIHMIGTCEAFNLAGKLGLDAQTFFDISSTASGQNWSMTSYCPAPGPVESAPSNRDYQPGFAAAMMLKDLRLAKEAATTARAATPMGAQAEALYALMEAAGEGGLDFSGVMKLIDGSL